MPQFPKIFGPYWRLQHYSGLDWFNLRMFARTPIAMSCRI